MIKIYVINLLKAKDRLKNISRHLNELGVEFEVVKGIDGSKIQLPHSSFSKKSYHFMHGKGSNLGELGCYFSHIKALRRFLETNENFALILEDDVTLLKETMLLIDQSILLHSDSWDILRITGLHSGTPIKFKRLFKKFFLTVNLTHQSGAGGYVINRKGADKIIKHLLPMKLPYDHAFDREWLFGAKTLFLQPFPVKQKFDDSYIAPLDSEKKYWIYRIPAAFYRSINSILRIIYRSIQALLLKFNEKVKKPRNK